MIPMYPFAMQTKRNTFGEALKEVDTHRLAIELAAKTKPSKSNTRLDIAVALTVVILCAAFWVRVGAK